MSLILDALRKSEAERRRGQAPDLFGQAVPARASHPSVPRQWPRLAAIGLLATAAALIALLIVLWWPRTGADSARPAAEARGTETVGSEAGGAAAPRVVPTGPRSAPAKAATAATVASTPPARVTAPVAAATPRTTAAPLPTPVPAATRIAVEPPAPPAAAAPTAVPPAAIPPVATAPAAARPAAEPAARAATTAATPVPLPPAVTGPAPAAARYPGPDVPLRLADLSSEERQQLPALKVSVHMWAPDGAHRFAIIDGTRVHEGDRIGDATVEAIEQDGVLLAWRGQRIRLPIR